MTTKKTRHLGTAIRRGGVPQSAAGKQLEAATALRRLIRQTVPGLTKSSSGKDLSTS